MAFLRQQPIIPLNTPKFTATESVESSPDGFFSENEPRLTLETSAAHIPSLVLPTPYQPAGGDGFDDLQAGFGAFPLIRLDAGQYYIENESMGREFEASIFSIKKLFVWQSGEADQGRKSQFVRSYDNLNTTCGHRLRDVLLGWHAKGYQPYQREMTEALAEIQSGIWQGQLVTLSIPPRSSSRLAAYGEVLQHRHRLRIPQTITRISVGEWIKTKVGGFHHWVFEFLKEVPRQ